MDSGINRTHKVVKKLVLLTSGKHASLVFEMMTSADSLSETGGLQA
jgi:hypothetical protein